MRAFLCAVLVLFAAGCASSPPTPTGPRAAAVIEADEAMVEGCEFLGSISKTAAIGTANTARRMVMKEAQRRGATHLIFTGQEAAGPTSFGAAIGRAYRCEAK